MSMLVSSKKVSDLNIRGLLEAAGLEVFDEAIKKAKSRTGDWYFTYKVRLSVDLIKTLSLKPDYELSFYPGQAYEVFDVSIGRVGFNGFGELFLELHELRDPDEVWLCIEFNDNKLII